MSDTMRLVYTKTAKSICRHDTWQQATLPIGNGILGANIYGETRKERLSLNEITLWSGGRNALRPNDTYNGGISREERKSIYDEISYKILNGEKFDKESLRGERKGYDNGYQPLGDFTAEFSPAPKKPNKTYERVLDLERSLCNVIYNYKGTEYIREYFADNTHNIISCRFSSYNKPFACKFDFEGKQNYTNSITVSGNTAVMKSYGIVKDNGLIHATVFAFRANENAVFKKKGGKLSVSNANNVEVIISSGTDYQNTFWDREKKIPYYYRTGETKNQVIERVTETVNNALKLDYNGLRNSHLIDYVQLYRKARISFEQDDCDYTTDELLERYRTDKCSDVEKRFLENLVFCYGRYLFISSARSNSPLPNNLQGLWNNKKIAPWFSDIHININEQMNYWISGACNLVDGALPLVKYVDRLRIPGRRCAEHYTGAAHGILANNQNTPFGFTGTGWIIDTWGWCPGAVAWLMQNCYEYYSFSQNREMLETTIYPYMREQCLFYEEVLKEKDGRLVMPITQSPEIAIISAGNTYEQSIIAQLYKNTIEAMKILDTDRELREIFEDTYEQLKPLEIGESGQIKEWFEETTINSVSDTRSHRHLSNMLGLYPFNLFSTPELKKAGEVSLNNKRFGHVGANENPEGGWTYAQLIGSWARINNSENAYFCISQIIRNRLYDNLFDYHEYKPFGAFQIDANFGYSAGVAEMLLQSHEGYIEVFPATPVEWNDISFYGLLARGNFEVTAERKCGKIIFLEIKAHSTGVCRIKNTEGFLFKGVNAEINNGIISFNAEKGKSYRAVITG